MDVTQTSKVLALAAVVDNRVVDRATIAAWHDLIGRLDFTDACEAVREHRRTSTEYLVPAHVIAGVHRIRAARLAAVPDPLPDVDPDDVTAYQLRRRQMRAAIASPNPTSRKEITRG